MVCSSDSNSRHARKMNGNMDMASISEFESSKTVTQNSVYDQKSFKNNNSNPSKNKENNKNNKYNIIESNSMLKKALECHNKYRKHNCANELIINFDLCELAQRYAEKCAETESIDHSPYLFNGDIISENIKEINDKNIDIPKICEEWMEELMNNNLDKKIHGQNMLWKESKEVGFGLSTSTKNKFKSYFVAFYYPAGNIFPKLNDNI